MYILEFILNNIHFGIFLEEIEVIADINKFEKLSNTSGVMDGIVMLGEEMIPIYNLALQFGYPKKKGKFLMVINGENKRFGIDIEDIGEILYVEEDAMKDLPELVEKSKSCVRRVCVYQNRNILILDAGKIASNLE